MLQMLSNRNGKTSGEKYGDVGQRDREKLEIKQSY